MLDPYSRFKTAEAYDTPKPPKLLNRIIEISSNKGDTVADFFMGGGRIVEETLSLERKGIFCDISQKACDIAINNVNKKIEKMEEEKVES